MGSTPPLFQIFSAKYTISNTFISKGFFFLKFVLVLEVMNKKVMEFMEDINTGENQRIEIGALFMMLTLKVVIEVKIFKDLKPINCARERSLLKVFGKLFDYFETSMCIL